MLSLSVSRIRSVASIAFWVDWRLAGGPNVAVDVLQRLKILEVLSSGGISATCGVVDDIVVDIVVLVADVVVVVVGAGPWLFASEVESRASLNLSLLISILASR